MRAEIARLVSYAETMTGMRKRKEKKKKTLSSEVLRASARDVSKHTRLPYTVVVIKNRIICVAAQQECILLSSCLSVVPEPWTQHFCVKGHVYKRNISSYGCYYTHLLQSRLERGVFSYWKIKYLQV